MNARTFLFPAVYLILAPAWMMGGNVALAEEAAAAPQIGMAFTELPPSIPELRYAFACDEGRSLEVRWIAQNVGEAAPPNFVIGSSKLVSKNPLNIASLTRPANGWPHGLYRLEIRHEGSLLHTQFYVIDDLK